ncbi:MAG: glutathione S-transferase N-terminal domain-containing protein [Candidatus Cloacimonetes bacterium]|nr:glutathione S-transferase N-terminal domain-containing protein [Candidatus Cloacimonadota bacterium]
MKAKRVIVFTTPTCSWCTKVKSFLKQHQVPFKEIDVSRDEVALRDMVKKSGQRGVPQLWINNRPIVGFDEFKIKKELEIL